MKRILITGAESYIGTAISQWLTRPEMAGNYLTEIVDMRGDGWRGMDFSKFDVIIHVAGIAHLRETRKNEHLFREINRDLAVKTAMKAKKEGVGQFLLFSTMNVYGKIEGVIREDTVPAPRSGYGKSKLRAEQALEKMNTETFRVAILRPPMVYGKGCKGNYPRLARLARTFPLFPLTHNRRSMIYIDNLAEFVRTLIDREAQGLFFPQNEQYVCTSDLVRAIAENHGRTVILIRHLETVLRLLGGNSAKKVLGTLIYEIRRDRCVTVSFSESVRRTER